MQQQLRPKRRTNLQIKTDEECLNHVAADVVVVDFVPRDGPQLGVLRHCHEILLLLLSLSKDISASQVDVVIAVVVVVEESLIGYHMAFNFAWCR